MSVKMTAWLWRGLLLLVQLLVIPLVVYSVTVTRDRDVRELQQYVADRYLAKEDWRAFVVQHEERTQERIAVLRSEIKSAETLLLSEIRNLSQQVELLSKRWDRRPPPSER